MGSIERRKGYEIEQPETQVNNHQQDQRSLVTAPWQKKMAEEHSGYECEWESEYDYGTDYASEEENDPECGVDSEYSYDYADESDWAWEADLEGRLEGEPGEAVNSTEGEPSGYDYADPYEYYGYDCDAETPDEADAWAESSEDDCLDWMEADEPCVVQSESKQATESGVELFAWHPSDLLLVPDQEILKTLETQCEEPSGARRATLNDYLEALGWEAIAFASRFEDVTGIEVLGLADDLPGAAAFLGAFRLLEQGELGMDEAVDLLRRSLQNLSLNWIEGVSEITADAFQDWEPVPTASEVEEPDWSICTCMPSSG